MLLSIVIILNLISLILLSLDKRYAIYNRRRIPEKYFYLLALSGGWLIGVLTIYTIKHKNRKRSFLFKYYGDNFSKFGYSFQMKLMAALFTDKVFLQQILDILDPKYFESETR